MLNVVCVPNNHSLLFMRTSDTVGLIALIRSDWAIKISIQYCFSFDKVLRRRRISSMTSQFVLTRTCLAFFSCYYLC